MRCDAGLFKHIAVSEWAESAMRHYRWSVRTHSALVEYSEVNEYSRALNKYSVYEILNDDSDGVGGNDQ